MSIVSSVDSDCSLTPHPGSVHILVCSIDAQALYGGDLKPPIAIADGVWGNSELSTTHFNRIHAEAHQA
jgi:hypothetical protein